MEYLEILDAQGRRRGIGLDRPHLLIGREPTCDIHLPHPNVSRRHAQLQKNDQGRWILQDLNSLNHVFVDNQPVQQVVLELGKRFRIAEYRLALQEGDPEQEPEPGSTVHGEPPEGWTGLEPNWLEQLQAFQRSLLRVEEAHLVLDRLAAEFTRILHPQLIAVGLVQPSGYRWEVICGDRDNGVHPCVAEEDPRLNSDDSDLQIWPLTSKSSDGAGGLVPVVLLFPIKGRSTILGHVLVQRPRFSPLPSAIQRYLTLLTSYAGLVWETFQLAALRATQKEMEQELRQARQIQIDLFPPTFDVDERLSAFAVNLPSVQVSGDYYDLFRTGPNTVAFVIADAMGHGMPAALMMAAVRASVRMGVSNGLAWEAVFHGLDQIITQGQAGAFVTGLLGEIDLARGELRLASAGHLPPSIVVSGKPVSVPENCQTRPWGMKFDCPWQVGRVALSGDWSILCFTDGVTDAAARARRGFGSHVMAEYHQRHHQLSAEDLCQGLLSEISPRTRSASLEDDQTVLVLRSNLRCRP